MMMSSFRLLTFLSILCAMSITILPAQADRLHLQQLRQHIAQNRSPNGELKIPAGNLGNLAKELNLSQDQIQQLQKLRKNSQGKTKERRQILQAARQELNQLIQGNASADRVRQKRQQVQSLQREIADSNFEQTLAIREILTPEQRVKLQQIMEQRRQNRLNSK
jgi:periplasmic protein CpxP/Spy